MAGSPSNAAAARSPMHATSISWYRKYAFFILAFCAMGAFISYFTSAISYWNAASQKLDDNNRLLQLRATQQLRPISNNLEERVNTIEEDISMIKKRFWQEELEPQWQYRQMAMLGKVHVEDRTHLLSWLLPNFMDVSKLPKRVYFDLGINRWASSICWFLSNYPAKFDEIHGFECCNGTEFIPNDGEIRNCLSNRKATSGQKLDPLYTLEEYKGMVHYYHNFVGGVDDSSTNPSTIGFSDFLRSTGVTKEDFVVVKMDIEGAEYPVIEKLIKDGTYKLIDELFVEVHYSDKAMAQHGWVAAFPEYTLAQAHTMFMKLRDLGVIVHPWP